MPEVRYDVLTRGQELIELVPAWWQLWQEDPDAKPFQSPDWLMPWWRQFGQAELRAVTICAGGKLVGFLPFYVYPEPQSGDRQLLLLGVGTTDYLDGIFAPTCTPQQVRGALDVLCAESGWDVLFATQLVPASKLKTALESFASIAQIESEACSRMPALLMTELPQKIRRNAMYYRNRALRRGALQLQIADSGNWSEAFDVLVRMHAARWQVRGESGVLADPKVLLWHREALPTLAESDLLRLCTLLLDEEPIGVLYSLIDRPAHPARTQYFYLTAFSEEYAELRPGTLLLALTIEAALNEGVQTIDMLRGDEGYKQLWHLERAPTCGFTLKNPCGTLGSADPAQAFG